MPPALLDQAGTQLCVAENRIQVSSQDAESARLVAQRLLRLSDVRSVLYDAKKEEVTVCLRRPEAASRMLGEVALLAGRQNELLRRNASTLRRAEEVVAWTDQATGNASYVRAPQQATGVMRLLLLIGAALSLVLGAIGFVAPGLPTTPFVLLASSCLLRSSRRLHDRLLDSKLFGPFLKDWHAHRAVRPGVKSTALATMGLVFALTATLSGLPWTALVGVSGCMLIGAGIVWRLPVIDR